MNILFLGYKNCKLFNFLNNLYNVTHTEEAIKTEALEDFDWVISFGYKHILKSDFISRFYGKIINLHISYLPYNRGSHPNVWSFVEDTPKGVTIHLIDDGIDTGDILLQKIVKFSDSENTLSSTYKRLIEEIQNLFIENSDAILYNKIEPTPQIGEYSYHLVKDLNKIKHLLVDCWETKISELCIKEQT
jgi:methionyl-tRNA formyltransferase